MRLTGIFLVFAAITSLGTPVLGEDIQLLLPDSNVSSRPILEFRAREATVIPPSPGHAYVLLGRELDNGLRVFNTVAGFYPAPGTLVAFKQVILTPGTVTQKLEDASSQITFSIYLTPAQEQRVGDIISAYDSSNYSLAIQNCVTMTKDIASSLGLDVPTGVRSLAPQTFLRELIKLNADRPPSDQSTSPGTGPAPPSPPTPNTSAVIDAGKVMLDLTKPFVSPVPPSWQIPTVPSFVPNIPIPPPPPPPPPPIIVTPPTVILP